MPSRTRAATSTRSRACGSEGQPFGVVAPSSHASADDVSRLGRRLDELEAQHGLPAGATGILPIATETAESVFSLGGFRHCSARLYGLTWGAEDLSAAVGATGNQEFFLHLKKR